MIDYVYLDLFGYSFNTLEIERVYLANIDLSKSFKGPAEGSGPPLTHLEEKIPKGQVAVDVMSWKLAGGIAEHRFVRFSYADANGSPHVLDFHGLATNREVGATRPVGVPSQDNIVIWPDIPTQKKDGQSHTEHLHRMGTFDVADARRMMAAIAVGGREINNSNIEYRALQTDPFLVDKNLRIIGDTTNSNAAARTMLELAGLNPDVVRGGWAPGYSGRLLPPKDGDHDKLSIGSIRSTMGSFSGKEVKEGVGMAFQSLRESIPSPKGDVLKLGESLINDIRRRDSQVEGLRVGMNDFLKDMNGIAELKMARPAPLTTPEFH